MPFFQKRFVASFTVAALLAQAFLPVSAWAERTPKVPQKNAGQSASVSLEKAPEILKSRLAKQAESFKKSGKTAKYAETKIRWSDEAERPSQIRGLSLKASKNPVSDIEAVLSDLSPLYGADSGKSKPVLTLSEIRVSERTGERHVRIAQSHSGIEILGGELIGHVDENGKLYQIDGKYRPDLKVSTTEKISAAKALETAQKRYGAKNRLNLSVPKKAILPQGSQGRLIWQYEASFEDEKKGLSRRAFQIDAETGKTIREFETLKSTNPANVTGNLLEGEGGVSVSLSGTYYTGNPSGYYLWDPYDRKTSVINYSSNSGAYVDADWYAMRPTANWGTSDRHEISAAYNAQKTLDFFKPYGFTVDDIAFQDVNQNELPFIVHYGTGVNNAFWYPGVGFYFGDGDGVNFSGFAALDVVAHEFGHAWTENTSNLIYLDEPGALNESFSDIVWATVELMVQPDGRSTYPSSTAGQSDWLMGEDIMRLPGASQEALRDLRNPANPETVGAWGAQPTRYRGTHWYFWNSDNGGVHQNSGVQNFFYYLLAEGGSGENDGLLYSVDGIGLDSAFDVAFETNSHFLPSDASHSDARQAWIDAANSLDSNYVASVEAAWDAVGVYAETQYPAFITADESFENGTSLPSGWTTGAGTGAWTVVTSTGAVGSNSLQSPAISDSQSASVSLAAETSTGYLTFFARTSTEAIFDELRLYVDGSLFADFSGERSWTPYAYPINAGNHTFEWRYVKDSSVSSGLDQVGIDAVHVESLTGTVSVVSATGENGIHSKNGLSAVLQMGGSGTYAFENSLGEISRGTGSGSVSVPLSTAVEGTGSVRFQYRNDRSFVSSIMEASFFVDATAPSTVSVLVPAASSGASVNVSWTASTDTGSSLKASPYFYEVASDSGFSSVTQSGTASATGTTLALSDGIHYVRVTSFDKAGNSSISATASVNVDTQAPNAPSTVTVNNGNVVVSGQETSVPVSAVFEASEVGGTAHFRLYSGTGLSVQASAGIDSSGFALANANLSSLPDGILSYEVHAADPVGNSGAVALGTFGKSVLPSDGNVVFASGSHVSSTQVTLSVSANKNVDFEITGDLASSVTGSVSAGSSIDVSVELSAGEGNKTVMTTFIDEASATSVASATAFLDLNAPSSSIASHSDGQHVTGNQIVLTGSASDAGGIVSLTLNGTSLPAANGNWSRTLPLDPGSNSFVLEATDHVGRVSTASVSVVRVPVVSHLAVTSGQGEITATFVSDIFALGEIEYSTDLSFSSGAVGSMSGTSHSISVSNLQSDTVYYVRAKASVEGISGQPSSSVGIKTPLVVNSAEYGNDVSATGSLVFSEATSTGVTFGSASGSVTVYGDDGQDSVTFPLDGLSISTTGWDGGFSGPRTASVSGSISDAGYSQTGAVYAIGHASSRLSFSGATAIVRINVGLALEGRTLRVYHSDDGISFELAANCQVTSGICEFQASRFSYYGFALASDSTPDAFSFTPKYDVELASSVDSDPVTLTGFNVPTQISIVGGTYSVNNGSFVSTTGNVSAGDSVKIRLVSSSTAYATSSATLTAWGTSSTFTVRTKNVAAPSGGGGGGGSGGGSSSSSVSSSGNAPSGTVSQNVSGQTAVSQAGRKRNLVASKNPYQTVAEIAKAESLLKLGKNATSKNLPAGIKPRIDRTVTERIVTNLKLETKKTGAEKANSLDRASAVVAKYAKSLKAGGEKAVWTYVAESLKAKADELRKPPRKKNVVTRKTP